MLILDFHRLTSHGSRVLDPIGRTQRRCSNPDNHMVRRPAVHWRLHSQRTTNHLRHRSGRCLACQQHIQQARQESLASERRAYHRVLVYRHQRRRDRINSRILSHHSSCNDQHKSQLPYTNCRAAYGGPTCFRACEMESGQAQCADCARCQSLHLLPGCHLDVATVVPRDFGEYTAC